MYWNIALIHVQTLKERCQKDLASDNYEGVITKSRTMLEEVFIYVIGEEYDRREYKGNIGKMFDKVKSICNINKDNVPAPIENTTTCLNSIVNEIAQIRKDYSESHGIGKTRVVLSEAETMLVINSSITLAEYVLSVYSGSSLNERTVK